MGLGCAALISSPSFPTYPSPLSTAQNNAGLSSPATAITLLGQSGAILMLVLLFMAVTSSTSAELIAVSSLLTFDVYKTYYKPAAKSESLVRISHYAIVLYALILAAFCCVLNAVGVNLTWLLTVLAIIVGGGAVPVGLVLIWKRTSTVAAIASPWIGLACGLTAWFVTAYKRSGEISIESTGDTTNAVAGNITSFGVGWVCCMLLTLAFPAKYVSEDPMHIERSNKIQGIGGDIEGVSSPQDSPPVVEMDLEVDEEKKNHAKEDPEIDHSPLATIPTPTTAAATHQNMSPMTPSAVRTGTRLALVANLIFILIAVILVPFTLFGTGYVYSKSFFTGWVVVSFIWVWCSMCICVVYPVIESWKALVEVGKGVWGDVMGNMFSKGGGS